MLKSAHLLRKKCAENVQFIKKTRESDSYNYFTSANWQGKKNLLDGSKHGNRPCSRA